MVTSPSTPETPIPYAEVLVHHPALPTGLGALPALPPDPFAGPPRTGWTFRPSVLATLVDTLAGRGPGAGRTGYREDYRLDLAVLIEPTGQETPMPFVGTLAVHCPPPPTVRGALDPARWTVAEHQPAAPHPGADAAMAVLATPDRGDIEETYVNAAVDVEQLDPATWVVVTGHWCRPARPGALIVPAGLVALYEPEIDAEPEPDPATLPEGTEWLPDCRHCGLGLVAPCSPGDRYPHPDVRPGQSPWCPQHPHTERPRPHAPIWRVVSY